MEKQVFTVNHVGLPCTAKEIHSLILDGISEEEKKAFKDGFIQKCYHSSLIDTSSEHIVQFMARGPTPSKLRTRFQITVISDLISDF